MFKLWYLYWLLDYVILNIISQNLPKLRVKNQLCCFLSKMPWLETVQDLLIKLGIKPLILHPLEISIFSLNNDNVRLTKIMNNLVKDLKILSFKLIFQSLELVESFQKKKICEEYLIRRPTYINETFQKL